MSACERERCGARADYQPYDLRTAGFIFLCKDHYREWAEVTKRPGLRPLPAGTRRLRANLARAEIQMHDEPTDLERYLITEEIEAKREETTATLRLWRQKLGE